METYVTQQTNPNNPGTAIPAGKPSIPNTECSTYRHIPGLVNPNASARPAPLTTSGPPLAK
eukprot:5457142-Lingulodinium_polyedra.AAC.1